MPSLSLDGMSFSGLAQALNFLKPTGYYTYHQI